MADKNIPSSNDFSGFSTNRPEQFGFWQGGEERATGVYSTYMTVASDRSQRSRKPKCEGYTYLSSMGIQVWREQTAQDCVTPVDSTNGGWDDLKNKAHACNLCALHATRTNVVFGVGNKQAEILLIGEAPGANEDLQGEPFVGRAGMLLNAMLRSIGLKREDVYIANILKCRPPNNRDPLPQEVALCTPFLAQQIALIKPKVIVAVGRIAAHFLLNTTEAMGRLRGHSYQYGVSAIPLFVIYHPAYLLRSPGEKAKAYADLLVIKRHIHGK